MLKYILSIFISLSFHPLLAQVSMSSQTKQNLIRIEHYTEEQLINAQSIKRDLGNLPIYPVNGVYCISGLVRVEPGFTKNEQDPRLYFGKQIGSCLTVKVPLRWVSLISRMPNVSYFEIAERIQPEIQKMVKDVRADSVWNGINLPKGFTGKNTLIGVTDWGFDYTHPMFMDTSLSKSRIRAAWDHFKINGNKPNGFNYGVEYKTANELASAQSDTAGTYYDYATHGSHVAGIAGGSGAGLGYRGVAFDASFLFNSIQLDVGAAIDAFTWMKQIAAQDNKRLVINMSWGLYYMGTMDGTSILSEVIDEMSKQGVVLVTSGGNNGGVNFHIKKTFTNDSLRSKITFYGYNLHPQMWGQCLSMWAEPNKPFEAGLEVYSSNNTKLASIPMFGTAAGSRYIDSFMLINTDTIWYNLSIDQAHPQNQRPHIRLRVKNKNTSLQVVLVSTAPGGTVHYWNVVELSNGVGNWGQALSAYGSNGVNGDANYGVGEPACTQSAISVAAHTSENVLTNGNLNPGNRANFSSKGPTYDERIKPDISAPGVSVISSINSFTTDDYTSVASREMNGRTYHFAAFSGTSMASPAAAGVVALLLEANPLLSSAQVKQILRSTARQDNRTGVINEPGSPLWGMGRITATKAVALALQTTGSNEIGNPITLTLFPNPAYDKLYLGEENQILKGKISIFNLSGQVCYEGIYSHLEGIAIQDLGEGLYVLQLENEHSIYRAKFVKAD